MWLLHPAPVFSGLKRALGALLVGIERPFGSRSAGIPLLWAALIARHGFMPSASAALDFDAHLNNHTVVDSLNLTFVALSDPTRRMMLDRLRNGSATVSQLAEPFEISQQAISKHLAYLEQANLIEKRREGRQQICTLRPAALKEASDWMDEYRQFWGEAFDRLDTALKTLMERKKKAKKNARRPRRHSI